MTNKIVGVVETSLAEVGIEINGKNPWDPQIAHRADLPHILRNGTQSIGETYRRLWDCNDLAELTARIVKNSAIHKLSAPSPIWVPGKNVFRAAHSVSNEKKSIQFHYDEDIEWYKAFLDPHMKYTCGYWEGLNWNDPNNLPAAQEAALHRVCRKLRLKPGMIVLDIGCGFGSFAKFAAKYYGVIVIGITLSKVQLRYAWENAESYSVTYAYLDYQDLLKEFAPKSFDRIVSIGMFEHVGHKNYDLFFNICRTLLKDDGFMVLHTIASAYGGTDRFTAEYIFPDGEIPARYRIERAITGKFVVEDTSNIGAHYSPTCDAWRANAMKNRDYLQSLNPEAFSDEFLDRQDFSWGMYSGSFRARHLQVLQYSLSPNGVPGGI